MFYDLLEVLDLSKTSSNGVNKLLEKVAKSCAWFRIRSDMGSDRIGDLGKEPDPNWSLAQKRLGKKEGHVG